MIIQSCYCTFQSAG